MHRDHEVFIAAIHALRRVRLTFFSKEDKSQLVRICAPMDYGPLRDASDKSNRYHSWDYESDTESHPLSLPAEQIDEIVLTEHGFRPSDFVTWDVSKKPWFVPRNWGRFS